MSSLQPVEGRAADQVPASVPARCKNCGALLGGRYCVNCSQAADVHVPTTRELFHELMEGLTHSDSRLWRTLKYLWFKPGMLTEEFIAGKRVAYLQPFRLYLILSIIFFLIASFMHARVQFIEFDRPASSSASQVSSCNDLEIGWLAKFPSWNERVKHACDQIVRDNDSELHGAFATMSKAMFIFLPLIAFLHMLFYWRPRHRYAVHLLFLVHLHAFFFALATIWVLSTEAADHWPKLSSASETLGTLLGWWAFAYTVVALRRVFRGSWVGTVFKSFALYLIYMVLLAITMSGAFVYAALQL
jgi:hypothetical protein